jgi:hypothetical protein
MHITHHRLHHQQISQQQFATPQQLVNWMGAMQAQDYEMAKWAIALRLSAANESTIETALSKGEILRTHILRPTWHIVAAENLRWMMDLSAPQLIRTLNSYNKQVGLETKDLIKAEKNILKILAKNNHSTRDEIMLVLQKEKIKTDDYRSAHIMFHCELNGLVCNGIRKGKEISYALLDERIPVSKKISREEALKKLAEIYFQSHSPATLKDFGWWSGLNQTDAKIAIESINKKLETIQANDLTYYVYETDSVSGDIPPTPFKGGITANKEIYLLPAFDEYLISYAHRFDAIEKEKAALAFTNNGIFKPVIIHQGKVIGIWKRTISGKKMKTEIFPFEKISNQLEKEIEQKMEEFIKYQTNL